MFEIGDRVLMPLKLLAHYLCVLSKNFTLLALSWFWRRELSLSRYNFGCLFEFGSCLGADVFDLLNVDVTFLGDLLLGNL